MHKSFTIPPALDVLLKAGSKSLGINESATICFCIDYVLKNLTNENQATMKHYANIYYKYHIHALPRGNKAKEIK